MPDSTARAKSCEIAQNEGFLSGDALYGTTVLAKRPENKDKNIVGIF